MKLLPIQQTAAENQNFLDHPDCQESIHATMDFYKKVGFAPPWIGYYAQIEDNFVGAAGFKGPPKAGKVKSLMVFFLLTRTKASA